MGTRAFIRAGLVALLTLWLFTAVAPLAALEGPDRALREALKSALEEPGSFDNRFDAQVWLLDMSTRLVEEIPDPNRRVKFLKALHYETNRAGLEPEWVLAVIDVESDFNRFAISHAGARGLMQIMPFWLEEIGRPDDNLFLTQTNLRMGCTILRHYLDRENGDLTRALARYNGSLGKSWYPNLVYQALNEQWFSQ